MKYNGVIAQRKTRKEEGRLKAVLYYIPRKGRKLQRCSFLLVYNFKLEFGSVKYKEVLLTSEEARSWFDQESISWNEWDHLPKDQLDRQGDAPMDDKRWSML